MTEMPGLRGAQMRIFVLDVVLVVASFVLGFLAAGGFGGGSSDTVPFLACLTMVLVATPIVIYWRQLSRINPRYLGFYDLANISFSALILALAESVVQFVMLRETGGFAISIPLLFAFFTIALLTSVRVFRRIVWQRSHYPSSLTENATRVLIVGAGDAGEAVWREVSRLDSSSYFIVGFVDDDVNKQGLTIHGIQVLGSIESVPSIAEAHEVTEIVIATPSATPEEMRRIFGFCSKTTARIRILPSYATFLGGDDQVLPILRDLQLEDLMRRDRVVTDMTQVAKALEGERVLITGAGGSIGSELARQVSRYHPSSLVLLGRGENSIFEIDQELRHRQLFLGTPLVCDVKDRQGLRTIFQKHYPSVVIHAAAHKHVPLMESVPIEAILNNVFGTLNAVEESIAAGAKNFILVSTDKAVRPSNVMGATKRVCEMILSSISVQSECSFAAVRFGNVLGSRGSLVPLLQSQIKRGGPITITHPEMTRYFMTIPEAVQLILQAGTIGKSGEIFILEMGQPVKIVDLVSDMIRMHGLVPGQDIEIKFIGSRPGEKLHEELSGDYEDLVPSEFEKIQLVADVQRVDWPWLREQLIVLKGHCEAGREEEARTLLMDLAWGKNIPPVQTIHENLAAIETPEEVD